MTNKLFALVFAILILNISLAFGEIMNIEMGIQNNQSELIDTSSFYDPIYRNNSLSVFLDLSGYNTNANNVSSEIFGDWTTSVPGASFISDTYNFIKMTPKLISLIWSSLSVFTFFATIIENVVGFKITFLSILAQIFNVLFYVLVLIYVIGRRIFIS